VSARLDDLHPGFQPWARWLLSLYPQAQVTSTKRSHEEQAALYAAYRRGESRYPALPPGRSAHERGTAIDIYAPPDVLEQLGQIWQQAGGRWGGPIGDPIHFDAGI
jgi:hypothetical protein